MAAVVSMFFFLDNGELGRGGWSLVNGFDTGAFKGSSRLNKINKEKQDYL